MRPATRPPPSSTTSATCRAYADAADDAIAAGFVLADDRADLIAAAQPGRIPA